MVDEINNIPYKERPYATLTIKQIINTKQKLGLGVENHNKILSEELHKPKRKNYPRRRIIVNHIDEIFAADLVEMQKFEKTKKPGKFEIGDRVRISLEKNIFEKGYETNWTPEIFVTYDIK